jgi:hypothetical protein
VTSYRKLKLFGAVVLVLALTLLACDTGNLIAFQNATATPTKTPRPTFTPQPSLTPTPEDTPTPLPAVTDTPKVPPTATRRAATARPATKAPTVPPPPPKPSFSVTIDSGYFCDQANDPIWEVVARFNRSSDRAFAEGYVFGVFTADGRLLTTTEVSPSNEYTERGIDINCRAPKFYPYSVKKDVSQFRMQVPLIIRVVRSKTDLTPLSPDFKADFAQPGRYFIEYRVPG